MASKDITALQAQIDALLAKVADLDAQESAQWDGYTTPQLHALAVEADAEIHAAKERKGLVSSEIARRERAAMSARSVVSGGMPGGHEVPLAQREAHVRAREEALRNVPPAGVSNALPRPTGPTAPPQRVGVAGVPSAMR